MQAADIAAPESATHAFANDLAVVISEHESKLTLTDYPRHG